MRSQGQWELVCSADHPLSDTQEVVRIEQVVDELRRSERASGPPPSHIDQYALVGRPADVVVPCWRWVGSMVGGRVVVERGNGHLVALDETDLRILDAIDGEVSLAEVVALVQAADHEVTEKTILLRAGQIRSALRLISDAPRRTDTSNPASQ